MSGPADAIIAALRSGHDELVAFVAARGETDLTAMSGATDWDISQVLSHLGSGAEIGLRTLTAATAPGAESSETNEQIWARWNAMTPTQRAASFPTANESLVATYESLNQATRAGLRIDLGFLPAPVDVATAGFFRLMEFALHSWDVRVGFDPAATLAPAAVPILLERYDALLGWVARPDADAEPVTLAVQTTQPHTSFGLVLGSAATLISSPASPQGWVNAPAEAWLRLVTGRLAAEHTPAEVTVSGEFDLPRLRAVFPGF